MTSEVTILHFNDVYKVEEHDDEPIGGATRFCTAIKSFKDLNPLILFCGDIIGPSFLSSYTEGKHMVPVLRHCGVHYSVFGNHEFDFGLDNAREFAKETQIPWMISNVLDNETGMPLGDGSISHIVEWGGKTFGLLGLVEQEWVETLSTVDVEELTYIDYVEAGKKLAEDLREQGAEYIIALTHMTTHNDLRLLKEVDTIDLILGGHDHVYELHQEGNRYMLKSGYDFREFSKIILSFQPSGSVDVSIQKVEVTKEFPEDEELKKELETFNEMVPDKMTQTLAKFSVDLDGRQNELWTGETNLGNWVCDVMQASLNASLCVLNSGTLRSKRIHRAGEFKHRDLAEMLPHSSELVLLMVKGKTIVEALENGVSSYPEADGRFPQVSGITFAFDPNLPAGQRVDPRFVKVGDDYINLEQEYPIGVKEYMYKGKDGYTMFSGSHVLTDSDTAPQLQTAILNYFTSIKNVSEGKTSSHRLSLATVSRVHTFARRLKQKAAQKKLQTSISKIGGAQAVRPLHRVGAALRFCARAAANSNGTSGIQGKGPKTQPEDSVSVEDLEKEACHLAPKIEKRILLLDEETKERYFADQAKHQFDNESTLKEAEEQPCV